MLKNMKIGKKIAVGYLGLFCLFLLNAVLFIVLLRNGAGSISLQERTMQEVVIEGCIIQGALATVAIVFAVVFSRIVRCAIVKPVETIVNAMEEMSKGNLHYPLDYRSKDEIGAVAEAYRQTAKTVGAYISDIDRAMALMAQGDFNIKPSQKFIGDFENIETSITKFIVQMSIALNDVKVSAEMVDLASRQVSISSQSLAQGATEQASSLEELSAAISEVSAKIKENAENSNVAKVGANAANAAIYQSNNQMNKLTGAMEEISESSSQIGRIIKTIEDIAFQTNILALNAAVEAARAGTAGKGFSVVADEVRNLASKSASAAQDTTALIESSLIAVENGVKLAKETAQALDGMAEGAEQTTNLIGTITEVTNHQAQVVSQITQSIEQVSSVVQLNSATSEESAAASEELSGQADILKSLMSQFIPLEDAVRGRTSSANATAPGNQQSALPLASSSANQGLYTSYGANKY